MLARAGGLGPTWAAGATGRGKSMSVQMYCHFIDDALGHFVQCWVAGCARLPTHRTEGAGPRGCAFVCLSTLPGSGGEGLLRSRRGLGLGVSMLDVQKLCYSNIQETGERGSTSWVWASQSVWPGCPLVCPQLAERVGGLAGAPWAGGKSGSRVCRKQRQTFLWLRRNSAVARMEADEN